MPLFGPQGSGDRLGRWALAVATELRERMAARLVSMRVGRSGPASRSSLRYVVKKINATNQRWEGEVRPRLEAPGGSSRSRPVAVPLEWTCCLGAKGRVPGESVGRR